MNRTMKNGHMAVVRKLDPRRGRLRSVALCSLALCALFVWSPACTTARADESTETSTADKLPLVYEGQGLRVEVTTIDPATGRMTGTLTLGKAKLPYVADVVETEDGDEMIVGRVTTTAGQKMFHAMEESDTVARVVFDGRTYRVARVKVKTKPKNATRPAPDRTADQVPPAKPRPKPTGRMVMKLHTVVDRGSANMKSHTVLAPDGWRVEGGAWWAAQSFFRVLPSQDIKVLAPDGRMVHIGPSFGATDYLPSEYARQQLGAKRPAEGTASEGSPIIYMPSNLEAWKSFIAEKGIRVAYPKAKNIRVDQVVVIPELTAILQRQLAPLKKQNEQTNRQSQAIGGGTFSFTDGAVLGASSSYELDGKRWEQLHVFGNTYSGLDAQVGRQLWWALEPNVTFRAPAGQLEANMPLMLAVSYSLRMTPQWAKMKTDHMIKMNQIAAKGAADRAKIMADSNREINRIIVEGHRQRETIRDATHRKVINSIRGVDDYTTEGGGASVQLPSDYDHVYTNGNGEYVLTNDANYNPNEDSALNNLTWKTMKPAGR